MKKVVILTGSELRHRFFRTSFGNNDQINVLASFCEGDEKSLQNRLDCSRPGADLQQMHLNLRSQSERDFFEFFVRNTKDQSNPIHLAKGDINETEYVNRIIDLNPDLLISYGCSIIKSDLLSKFSGKFINIHLGLSPYYRGAGTNYWPLVNNEPELVGGTFMHIDEGVDTGEVIHQLRARCFEGDSPHQIGNRFISDMTEEFMSLVLKFDRLVRMKQIPVPPDEKYYMNKHFSPESVEKIYTNFRNGMVNEYLENFEVRVAKFPILSNPGMEE